MRSQWTKKYDESVQQGSFDPRSVKGEVRTLNGGFTDLSGLKERLREKGEEREWADLVIMAQAWHWAHPDYDAAIVSFQLGGGRVGHSGTERAGFERFAGLQKEIASIMKPDGVLVFIWNNEKSVALHVV